MNSENIELANLPSLDVTTGMFGSVVEGVVYDDAVVGILVYLYDSNAFQALT